MDSETYGKKHEALLKSWLRNEMTYEEFERQLWELRANIGWYPENSHSKVEWAT